MEQTLIGSDSSPACVRFRLGKDGFGIPLSQVREIAAVDKITIVPLAPAAVRGLVCLRGHVVTLIDVATIFERELPVARSREDCLMVILAEPYQHLGIYVHAPVEIGRTTLQSLQPAATPLAMVAAIDSDTTNHRRRGGDFDSGLDIEVNTDDNVTSGEVVHLLSTREIIAWCDARVLEGFRRRN